MSMFARHGQHCVAVFPANEARLLRQIAAEVIGLVTDDFDRADPAVRRLFPDLYRDDPEAAAELREFTEGELRTGKVDQAGAILAALPSSGGTTVRLDGEEAQTWLRAINDGRLALGVRLEIKQNGDDADLLDELDEAVMADPTSERVHRLIMYSYLTELQESLLYALMEA
jgi:hypothetical protein